MSNVPEESAAHVAQEKPPGAYSGAPLTLFLTIACALVFACELWLAVATSGEGWSAIGKALFAIPKSVAIAFGANYATATLYEGRIDTLVASCFVHFGILHIGFNLYALRQIGPFLEHEVGTGRTSLLYLGSGIVGSMVSALTTWHSEYWGTEDQRTSAGASGAICGLIGATLIVGFRTQGWRSPLMRAMAVWLIITMLLGVYGGFDNAAHGGGALGGALIALLWRRGGEPTALRKLSIGLTIATIAASGIAVAYFDFTRPFAAMEVEDRIDYAKRALLRRGNCPDAWAAIRSARRLAPRSTKVLLGVQTVRAHCGNDPHAPPPSDSEVLAPP